MDLNNVNEWADFWRYQIGVNVIPAVTRNKRPIVEWKQYQNVPITEDQHNGWKEQDKFKDRMALLGKVWHNDAKKNLYLILVDLDNQKAIEEFCTYKGVSTPLQEIAKGPNLIVEQHNDEPHKAHVLFYASHPFPKKSSDKAALSTRLDKNQVPAIEVKGAGEHGLLFCTPSPHGYNYEIIGTTELNTVVDAFESHIDNICSKYGIPYLNGNGNGNGNNLTPIKELFNEDTKIYEGHNRHEALLRAIDSRLILLYNKITEDEIKSLAIIWNQKHCIPPLDDKEFNKQWKQAKAFITKQINAKQQQAQTPTEERYRVNWQHVLSNK